MDHTYEEYSGILQYLTDPGYVIKDYRDIHNSKKEVVLRHDVDFSLEKAVRFVE